MAGISDSHIATDRETGRKAAWSRRLTAGLIYTRRLTNHAFHICQYSVYPRLCRCLSFTGCELRKIHKKENWFKRGSTTLTDNGLGLAMAMLSAEVVESYVEVESFSNLWGLFSSRYVVSEGAYEALLFGAEFVVALIVFTLTDHFYGEYKQRKASGEQEARAKDQG